MKVKVEGGVGLGFSCALQSGAACPEVAMTPVF